MLEWLHGLEFRSHASGVILRSRRASTATMVETLTAFRAAIAWAVARHQYNLLDSHDTARIASMLGGDLGRVRAALGFLLTYVGVPSILFYGDEIGLEGDDDLLARRPMPWDRAAWDVDLLAFVRTLVRLRRRSARPARRRVPGAGGGRGQPRLPARHRRRAGRRRHRPRTRARGRRDRCAVAAGRDPRRHRVPRAR